MRKLIPVLIVAALILSLLAACTTTPQSVTPTPSTDADDSQTSTPTPSTDAGDTQTSAPSKQGEGADPIHITIENRKSPTENDFEDNIVGIVLTNEATILSIDKTYTIEDFPEIDAIKINEIGDYVLNQVRDQIHGRPINKERDLTTYRRMFSITLSQHDKDNVLSACSILAAREDIFSAEPNYYIYACSSAIQIDDPLADSQWGLEELSIFDAWTYTMGSSDIIVGVLDTGIDASHNDLSSQIHTSLHRDFVSTDNANGDNVSTPTDLNWHGTMVAGIIAATANNTIGIAGVSPNIKLVSLRILDENGIGNMQKLAYAIQYAEANEIPILNCSLVSNSQYYLTTTAINNYSGLIVCAAGNDGLDINTNHKYPACYSNDNIISVGATNENYMRWGYNLSGDDAINNASNFGSECVDLFAPGEDIYTTYPGNLYAHGNGTSLAAPFVTGVAALLLSYNNNLTPSQIKQHIMKHVSTTGNIYDKCVSHGILNAYAAFTINLSGYIDIGDDTYHYAKCTVCDGAHELNNRQQHGYSGAYSFYNNHKHSQNCFNCTHKIISNHISGGGYTNQGTNVGHKTNCSVCGFDYIEAHSWLYNNAFGCYICRKCPARSYNGQSPYGYHDKEMQ